MKCSILTVKKEDQEANNIEMSLRLEKTTTKCKQDRQCTYESDIEVRSRNHFCHRKTVSIKYYECVCSLSYPARNAHAPYYIVMCGLSRSTIVFHIIS
jgi:hypothetical protein